jgi:hypothetical protein
MEIPISERQFAALARLAGIKPTSKTFIALKLHFTKSVTMNMAAQQAGCGHQTARNAKVRIIQVIPTIPGRIVLLQEAMGQ